MSKELSPETFPKTFDAYFWKWWIVVGILYVVAFSLYSVSVLNRTLNSELPSFVRLIANFASGMGEIAFGVITIGFISIGALTVGVVAIGACSVGIIAFGAFSVGIIAFGGNSLGVIAIGAGTSYGMINIRSAPRGRFDIGKAVGIVAIGPEAYGVYTLSYAGKGRYTFSPEHQDAEAVALFTRRLPKFKKAFSLTS